MKICLAQINATLGDFKSNAEKILKYTADAKSRGVDLVLFPECSLFGYHPVDLLEKTNVVNNQIKQISSLQKRIPPGIAIMIGAITENNAKTGKSYFNSALLIQKNKPMKTFNKELLPTYDVFDEARHIEPGDLSDNVFTFKGKKILVTICEDIWAWTLPGNKTSKYKENPLKKLKGKKLDCILNLSASPYHKGKEKLRLSVVKRTAGFLNAPMIYSNLVGGQDELIFEGASLAVDKKGNTIGELDQFIEQTADFELINGSLIPAKEYKRKKFTTTEQLFNALCLGIKDFVEKTGFTKVHLGLSGGVDSAVVAGLVSKALGGDKLTCIGLPGPFNDSKSLQEAKVLSENLGSEWIVLPIDELYNSELKVLENTFGALEFSLVHENLQARSRGLLLMAYSNLKGSLLLNTSNKSELAMGYSTLYGDLTGGLSPLGDLTKTEVFKLAEFINKDKVIIPRFIIDRPPSAELRPNQVDEDSLPKYEELDKSVEKLVTQSKTPRGPVDKRVFKALMKTEFKRWQAPPVLKVSDRAFGRGRRLPIAHRASL